MRASLYDKTRKNRSLYNAWRVVHSNGVTSKSDTTRKLINEFSENANTHLSRIERQLREKRFRFLPSEGILKTKPGKSSKRPIVLAPIENRIVQRAILDTLQTHPPLKKYFTVTTSFGGIKDRGVSDALRAVYTSIQTGAKYFIRSDIESFFTRIPKSTITHIIKGTTTDNDFLELFEKAIQVELSNLDELGKNKDAFPIYDIGVAQGSSLSPLLGNILLSEFDKVMNERDITSIRYIDDFIILAPSQKAVSAAFKRAQNLINKHGLNAYDPIENKDKAEAGRTSTIFSFLGCDIRPGMIRPNRKSQKRLLTNLDELFSKSLALMGTPEILIRKHRTVTETLNSVSNIMRGWGNQYSYCNDYKLMEVLDQKVNKKIASYLFSYAKWKDHFEKNEQQINRRRLLGVHLLTDSKKDPIIPT